MHTLAPALAVVAALIWPAAASAQSLAEVAQREAARKKAEAKAGDQRPAPTALPSPMDVQQSSPVESSSGAISLAEVARREAARRKALAASGQRPTVLTTSDVKKWEPPAESPTSASATAGEEQKGEGAGSADKPHATDAQNGAADEAKGEDYWHNRVAAAREELRRNESFAEALQSRINALSAEFAAKDDPYQRAQVADDRQKALAELDRLTQEIDKGKKSISDIEEEARRAGVPAGWIR